MDYTKRLITFVTVIIISLLSFSIFVHAFHLQIKPFDNISIISDIVKKQEPPSQILHPNDSIQVKNDAIAGRVFIPFTSPDRITEYKSDATQVTMKSFVRKLIELKNGKRKKIRIAFLGDSMIEGDYISETVRKLLQAQFGGYGVGFLSFDNKFNTQRTSASVKTNNFSETNFKNNSSKINLFLSGRTFRAQTNATAYFKDNTISTPVSETDKYLLYGLTNNSNELFTVNGKILNMRSDTLFAQQLLDASTSNTLQLQTSNAGNLYGVSFESPTGIVVDNFSFRGILGYEFMKFDSVFLSAIEKTRQYDLIIFEYGINLIDKPTDINFNWYYKPFIKSILHIKNSFPQACFIVMGCADRAYKYDNDYKTAIGLNNIIDLQQKVAYETSCGFYNTFISMGGEGTMAKWVEAKPALAYRDYMHPNAKGSEIIGKSIFNAIMFEYNKLVLKK